MNSGEKRIYRIYRFGEEREKERETRGWADTVMYPHKDSPTRMIPKHIFLFNEE
jgi:hypothetical protein